MAFIKDNTNSVTSFAEYADVQATDQRLFESNEGLTDVIVNGLLTRATGRILNSIKYSDWYRDLYLRTTTNPEFRNSVDVPDVNPNKILLRQSDFTDLCVYYALFYYILPKVADFSKEDNSERAKIAYYQQKYNTLWMELLNVGDWYDIQGNGSVTVNEKVPGNVRLHRIR